MMKFDKTWIYIISMKTNKKGVSKVRVMVTRDCVCFAPLLCFMKYDPSGNMREGN